MGDPSDTDDASNMPDSLRMRCARHCLNTHKPGHVPARILWPALGFPAVIAPQASGGSEYGDGTRCVCVLLLSDRPQLSASEAADHLRYVPWTQRHTRYLEAASDNSFQEGDLVIHNNENPTQPKQLEVPTEDGPDDYVQHVRCGFDEEGENGLIAGLSVKVKEFYANCSKKLRFLHEIRVSQQASGRLAAGLYHLLWVNADENDTEEQISDEMHLLLQEFAQPRLKAWADDVAKTRSNYSPNLEKLLQAYEFEYGSTHPPYNSSGMNMRPVRAEVLHPLFVRASASTLKIGHLTDIHVDIRLDVYEANLKNAPPPTSKSGHACPAPQFGNWNRNFVAGYQSIKKSADLVLLTGDLIDYGRGHLGPGYPLGEDEFYVMDRNWFLFYYFFSSGDAYQKPVYTILGNHDWRLNPYPPLAIAGAPNAKSYFDNYLAFKACTGSDKEWIQALEDVLKQAHGPGYEKKFAYSRQAEGVLDLMREDPRESVVSLMHLLAQTQSMDRKGFPTETNIDSVLWYLLTINPFLDYTVSLPGGFSVLMLDWAEKENVLFPIITGGVQYPFLPWQAAEAASAGPKARNCLTALQQALTQAFLDLHGRAKVVGIHAPPLGPYPVWTDDMLLSGSIRVPSPDPNIPGQAHFQVNHPDGTITDYYGHPFFAVKPENGLDGQSADFGTFEEGRDWFIKELNKAGSTVRLVFSGHIHRSDLLLTYIDQTDPKRSYTGGQLRTKSVISKAARSAQPPAITLTPEGTQGPLYVNTVCGGPRGNYFPQFPPDAHRLFVDPGYALVELRNDGTIVSADFFTKDGNPAS